MLYFCRHSGGIAAAGIYVELVLAAMATFLWWFTEPGLLHFMCLSVMFLCSVNALIFNGNPLLRFDGYFVLSHLIEIPNLRQKATEVVRRWILRGCLGIKLPASPYLPERNQLFMGCHSIAAAIYRWVAVLSIVLFLNAALEPYGLKIVGRLIGLIGLFGLVIQPAIQLIQFLRVPGRLHDMQRRRLTITLTLAGAAMALVALVPLPTHVSCPCTVELQDAEPVFVSVPGRLVAVHVEAGGHVSTGAPIAQLKNPDLEISVSRLRRQRDELQNQLKTLDAQQN